MMRKRSCRARGAASSSSKQGSKQVGKQANQRAFPRKSSRSFLTKSYPTMKKHNPSIPIMLREATGTLPRVYARYEFGQEKSQSLEGTPLLPPHYQHNSRTPTKLGPTSKR